MTAVAFSDILGFGLGFVGCGLVNITELLSLRLKHSKSLSHGVLSIISPVTTTHRPLPKQGYGQLF